MKQSITKPIWKKNPEPIDSKIERKLESLGISVSELEEAVYHCMTKSQFYDDDMCSILGIVKNTIFNSKKGQVNGSKIINKMVPYLCEYDV